MRDQLGCGIDWLGSLIHATEGFDQHSPAVLGRPEAHPPRSVFESHLEIARYSDRDRRPIDRVLRAAAPEWIFS
jgi:hypothetical protein